ncbi:MAG: hypothetical protein ABJE66_13485 [Deltaproteobacteria bacterium]
MSNVRGRRRGPTPGGIAILILFLGVPLAAVATCGASKLDSWMPDGESIDTQAWLRTQDVAPGDTVAVRVAAKGGYRTTITSMTARFGSANVAVEGSRPDWGSSISARGGGEDAQGFTLDIPADTPQRESTIELKIAMVMAVSAGDRSFVNREGNDSIQLPITMRSPAARTFRRWMHRGMSLLSWLVSFGIAYWLVRLIPRAGAKDPDAENASEAFVQVLVLLIFGGIFLIGVAGQVAFVRPLLSTMATDSWFVTTGLMVLWMASLGAGGWRGMRRRTQLLRWSPLRLRSVIGSTVRTLPPELLRDATRHSDADVAKVIEAAGCTLTKTRQTLDVTHGSDHVMRMRPKKSSPWTPEELRVEVYDERVPVALLRDLTALFGPLQYRTLTGVTEIVEASVSP